MKNKYILFAAIMLLPLAGLTAQDKGGESNSYSIFSFDIGFVPYIPFDDTATMPSIDDGWAIGSYFGLNIRIAEPLTIGVGNYGGFGTTSLSFLKVKYDIIPLARAVIGFGVGINSSGTPTNKEGRALLGFEIVPFARKIGGLASEFKLDVNYNFPFTELGKGGLCLGLVVGIGI